MNSDIYNAIKEKKQAYCKWKWNGKPQNPLDQLVKLFLDLLYKCSYIWSVIIFGLVHYICWYLDIPFTEAENWNLPFHQKLQQQVFGSR
jgi:hypothetical protein